MSVFPNVFPELVHCTLNGSTLIIKNSFIDLQGDSSNATTRKRAQSAPPTVSSVSNAPTRGRANTLLALRQDLLPEECQNPDSSDIPFRRGKERDDSSGGASRSTTASSDGTRCAYGSSVRPRFYTTATCTPCSSSVTSQGLCGGQSLPDSCGEECEDTAPKTTVIIRNLPDQYTRASLLATLSSHGFLTLADFMYMPLNFGTNASFGYAFINFVTPEAADFFTMRFQGFNDWSVPSGNSAYVEWSDERQGLQGLIERYRNSSMMHQSIADEAKPMLLQDGLRVEFPAPTRVVKPMRVRAWKRRQPVFADLTRDNWCGNT